MYLVKLKRFDGENEFYYAHSEEGVVEYFKQVSANHLSKSGTLTPKIKKELEQITYQDINNRLMIKGNGKNILDIPIEVRKLAPALGTNYLYTIHNTVADEPYMENGVCDDLKSAIDLIKEDISNIPGDLVEYLRAIFDLEAEDKPLDHLGEVLLNAKIYEWEDDNLIIKKSSNEIFIGIQDVIFMWVLPFDEE